VVWHLKLIVKTLLWPKWGTAIKTLFLYLIISGKFCVIKTLFGFKILFVVSLIFAIKNRNRPSKIHCLNSDWTGDLSLLRYKPDFATSLFAINELYCTTLVWKLKWFWLHKHCAQVMKRDQYIYNCITE
jgi:hypothetical protein